MNKSNTNKILDLIEEGEKNLEDLLEEYIIKTKKNPFKQGEFSEDFLSWKNKKEKKE